MSDATWSVQTAKNHFSSVIKAARHAPQTVTKHGKAAVVILDASEYERLRSAAKARAPSLPELLLAMPKDDGEFERMEFEPRDIDF
jgi:prevent-host-death family protein